MATSYVVAGPSSGHSKGPKDGHKDLTRPELIVFDLDYTLWPFFVDTGFMPPFKKDSNGRARDSCNSTVASYREVPYVLHTLHEDGYQMAIASRTGEVQGAKQLIGIFEWDQYFSYMEIHPGSKVGHFESIHNDSGFPYHRMLFFDDELRNIRDVSALGVVCIHVKKGVDISLVTKALETFKKRATETK